MLSNCDRRLLALRCGWAGPVGRVWRRAVWAREIRQRLCVPLPGLAYGRLGLIFLRGDRPLAGSYPWGCPGVAACCFLWQVLAISRKRCCLRLVIRLPVHRSPAHYFERDIVRSCIFRSILL